MGIGRAGLDMVLGLWEFATDPIGTIKAQVEFIQQVVQEPVILLEIGQMLVDSFMEDVIHGTSYTRGEWMGYAIGLIGLSALGDKGASKLGSVGRLANSTRNSNGQNQAPTPAITSSTTIGNIQSQLKNVQNQVDRRLDTIREVAARLGLNQFQTSPLPVNVIYSQGLYRKLDDHNHVQFNRIDAEARGNGNNSRNDDKGTDKSNLKVQFTKEQLATKPSYSPAPDKWTKKGGTVKIDEDGTWVYTNKKGQTVRYPNGYPDFTEYAHPTVKPVEIEIASPTNRPLDNKNANKKAGLNKDSAPPVASLNEAPEGYTWHHHQDGKTMILVDKKVHREFTHAGGVSIVNGN